MKKALLWFTGAAGVLLAVLIGFWEQLEQTPTARSVLIVLCASLGILSVVTLILIAIPPPKTEEEAEELVQSGYLGNIKPGQRAYINNRELNDDSTIYRCAIVVTEPYYRHDLYAKVEMDPGGASVIVVEYGEGASKHEKSFQGQTYMLVE